MLRRIAMFVALGWLWVTPALGASAQEEKTADDRAQSFQAVSGGTQEDVAGGPLMLLAYAAVWLVVFGYVYRINKLQRGVEANLDRLERSIAGQGGAAT
jgi:CcmD family protein